jgi:hypothetical protein
MSEPVRTADPAPRTARIARVAARPAPGVATAVLCGLALAFAGVHETLRPAAAALPAPAAGRAHRQAGVQTAPRRHARSLAQAQPAALPARLTRRAGAGRLAGRVAGVLCGI